MLDDLLDQKKIDNEYLYSGKSLWFSYLDVFIQYKTLPWTSQGRKLTYIEHQWYN